MTRTDARTVAPPDLELAALSQELDRHWDEIGRIFLSRRLGTAFQAGLSVELSPMQLHAIAVLAEGRVRIRDLAARLGLAESSVTRLVDRLEGQRFVVRRVLPADRRSVAVELTTAGRRAADLVARKRRAFLTTILETLEPAERVELVRLFSKVAAVRRDQEASAEAALRGPSSVGGLARDRRDS